jgi:hypothetical protein
MTQQPPATRTPDKHPGMMGDGTEEQDLNQKGDPGARITEAEVNDAFGEKAPAPPKP